MKNLYGQIKLNKNELLESDSDYMELEYYKISNNEYTVKEDECTYGIEVIKNEYIQGEKQTETCNINHITNDENLVNEFIDVMQKNKVTPCTLKDTLTDYIKSQENQD